MGSTARTPSSEHFVVLALERKPIEIAALRSRLVKLGWVEEIEGHPDMALVHPEARGQGVRKIWERLQKILGCELEVEPALMGAHGDHHYPTGKIQVRFRLEPSDDELKLFAKRHRLKLRGRNEFVPIQAEFIPEDRPGSYLPDQVAALEADSEVQAAWADTLSRYRRELAPARVRSSGRR